MLARLRAVAAVSMLVGIFVVVAMVLGSLVGTIMWVVHTGTPVGALVGVVLLAVAAVLVVALVRIVRTSTEPPGGVGVSVMAEPDLWALVREAAAVAGTRSPDEIRIVVEAEAALTEDSRFLGLVPGARVLSIGVPLLQNLTRAELLWVLGHEMSHHSDRHTPMSGVTRRGLVTLEQVVESFGPRHPAGWLLRAYLVVYARVVQALWRGQELDADRWATALTGPEIAASALRAATVASATWGSFARDHASVGAGAGLAPQPLFAGYADFLSDPARPRPDVDQVVADEQRSPFDTHPSTRRRIDRLRSLPVGNDTRRGPQDDEPALLVLADATRTILEVEAHVARTGSLTPAPWDRAIRSGNRRRDDERAVRVMAAVDTLTTGTADLSQALDLVARGGSRRLAEVLTGSRRLDDEEVRTVVLEAMQALVRSALVGAGHASHVLRWGRPDTVVDEAGVEVDVRELVSGVPGSPATAEWILEVLREEGILHTWTPRVDGFVLASTDPEVLATSS